MCYFTFVTMVTETMSFDTNVSGIPVPMVITVWFLKQLMTQVPSHFRQKVKIKVKVCNMEWNCLIFFCFLVSESHWLNVVVNIKISIQWPYFELFLNSVSGLKNLIITNVSSTRLPQTFCTKTSLVQQSL